VSMRLLTCLMLCLALNPVNADELLVRSEVIPEEPWIGQRVILQIDVLAPDAWAMISGFGNIELSGAYVLPPKDEGVRLQETVDGTSYSGQRYEISIYPQRSGRFELEMDTLEIEVRTPGDTAGSVTRKASLPTVKFDSRVPLGAEGIRGLISTTRLTAGQEWDPEPGEMQVGDAIKRTITLQAAGISGMAFEPLGQEPIEGLAVYPAQPRVDDKVERGTIEGSRIETFTYVAERSGSYTLPAIVLEWWDIKRESLERIELPGASFKVVRGSQGTAAGAAASPPVAWIALAALVIILLLAFFLLRHTIANWWKNRIAARKQTEHSLFRVLEKSVRNSDSKTIFRNLMRWLDSTEQSGRPARLEPFVTRFCEPPEQELIMKLQKAAIHDEDPLPQRKLLLRALRQARRRKKRERHKARQASVTLPSLNPDM